MSNVSLVALCAATLLCALAPATAEQPIFPIPGQPLPVPPPPSPRDPARFGEPIQPINVIGAPAEIHKHLNDRPLNFDYRLQLAPGEKVFVPSGRNEPVAILDQSISQLDPAAPNLIHRFDAGSANGWNPADVDVAVAAGYTCQVLNDDNIVFDKCGNQLLLRDANDLFPFDTSYTFYSPRISWDAWSSRWIMLWHLRRDSEQHGRLVLAVSAGPTPIGLPGSAWTYYNMNFVQNAGTADATFPDSYDLGYSDD